MYPCFFPLPGQILFCVMDRPDVCWAIELFWYYAHLCANFLIGYVVSFFLECKRCFGFAGSTVYNCMQYSFMPTCISHLEREGVGWDSPVFDIKQGLPGLEVSLQLPSRKPQLTPVPEGSLTLSSCCRGSSLSHGHLN